MKKVIWIIVGMVIPALLLYAVFTAYGAVFEDNVVAEKAPFELYVEEGTTLEDVYQELFEEGVLKSPEGLLLIGQRKGLEEIRTGHYVIEAGMSSNGIVNMFKAGLQSPVKISFNGAKDIAELAGILDRQLLTDSASLYMSLKSAPADWNGDLVNAAYIPETYEVYWNAPAEKIAQKLFQYTLSFWTEERIAKSKNLGLSPQEVGVLASIVMKESSKKEDRPLVARLYLNRLAVGMKLQSDPTVIRAIKESDPHRKVQRVLRKDLDLDSPYNTYRVAGLPPGPLCVPEKNALLAVLDAPDHNYVYMCADPDKPGYHAFAVNYNEHLKNRRRWTEFLNKQGIYK